jgi:hypothetical protein
LRKLSKRKCSNELIPFIHHDPKPVRRSPIDGNSDRVTEIKFVDLARSPVCIVPYAPVSDSFVHELSERILGDPRSELASALGRAIGSMAVLDVTNRTLGDDYLARRSNGRILRPSAPNAEEDDADGNPCGRHGR